MFEQPVFSSGQPMQITPKGVAIRAQVQSTLSSSVEVNLSTGTKFLRLYATSQDVFLRWGIQDANSSLFDEIIPAGQVVDLVVPNQSDGNTPYTAFNIVERASSAAIVIIEK